MSGGGSRAWREVGENASQRGRPLILACLEQRLERSRRSTTTGRTDAPVSSTVTWPRWTRPNSSPGQTLMGLKLCLSPPPRPDPVLRCPLRKQSPSPGPWTLDPGPWILDPGPWTGAKPGLCAERAWGPRGTGVGEARACAEPDLSWAPEARKKWGGPALEVTRDVHRETLGLQLGLGQCGPAPAHPRAPEAGL